MTLIVRAEKCRLRLWLPLSGWSVRLALRIARKSKEGAPSYRDVRPVLDALKKWKREHGSFVLAEIESKDAFVKIKL